MCPAGPASCAAAFTPVCVIAYASGLAAAAFVPLSSCTTPGIKTGTLARVHDIMGTQSHLMLWWSFGLVQGRATVPFTRSGEGAASAHLGTVSVLHEHMHVITRLVGCRRLRKGWAAWHQGLAAWRLQDAQDLIARTQAEVIQVGPVHWSIHFAWRSSETV